MAVKAARGEKVGFRIDRYVILGVIGVVIAVLLFMLVSGKLALSKVSTLRFTWPDAKPVDPPLLDIPLPTVVTVGVISALLIAGAFYVAFFKRTRSFSLYTGLLIFATMFVVLIW